MGGPDPAYPIKLETAEHQQLLKLSRATTAPQAQVLWAKILLLAHDQPEFSNVQIAQQIGCGLVVLANGLNAITKLKS